MRSNVYLLLSFLLTLSAFPQGLKTNAPDTTRFDEAFYGRIADQKHLKPAERAEFIAFQRREFFNKQLAKSLPVIPQLPATTSTQHSKSYGGSSQTYAGPCYNVDFETGTSTNWTLTSGFHPNSTNTPACCPTAGGVGSVTTGGTDPYGGFPRVFPGGGSFSYVLGDNINGAHADRLTQTFFVTPANANFTYRYAVVLQDPGHNAWEQPAFVIQMMDSLGNAIPCTAYSVTAGANIPGFQNSSVSGVIYKNWTSVALDLSPVIGQNVTIQFTTYDCSLGGHFGYAYVDGFCTNFDTFVSDTTCAGVPATMCGPIGFATYSWSGPGISNYTNQCLTTTAAGIYTCETILVPGCPGPTFVHTLNIRPDPTVGIVPPTTTLCFGTNSTVLTATVAGGTTPYTYTWSNGANTSTINAGVGNYSVFLNDKSPCPSKTVATTITQFSAPVTALGGPDQTLCKNTPTVSLSGSVVIATGATWSGGTGTFALPTSTLSNTYYPSASEIASGSVQLLLTTTGNQGCAVNTDTVIINFQNSPVPSAGADKTVCANNNVTNINASISAFTATPLWTTTGSGTLAPTNSLNITYTPSPADNAAGTVTLVLTTANNGVCAAVRDTVLIHIIPSPVVNAGADFTICSVNSASNINSYTLAGNITGPTNTGTWSTSGDGSFTPANNVLNAAYTPGPSDLTNGTVTLTLRSTNNGLCFAEADDMKLTIVKQLTVNAGVSKSMCAASNSITLTGSITSSSANLVWSAGTGTFNSTNTLTTTYLISKADKAAGFVIFTLTANGSSTVCPAVMDTVKVKIDSLATVLAGGNRTICSVNSSSLINSIQLNAQILGQTNSGVWTTSGNGNFTPSALNLGAVYNLGSNEVTTGTVNLILTSANNGTCPAVRDTVKVRIIRQYTVSAGITKAICGSSGTVALTGSVTGTGANISWAGGSGTFNNTNTLITSYTMSAQDKLNGSVIFTITAAGTTTTCPAVIDTVMVKVDSVAKVHAGAYTKVCAGNNVQLFGTVVSAAGSGSWSSSGTGTFSPSSQSLVTIYVPSPTDIANGLVTFSLNSTKNGQCASVGDTMRLRIIKTPTLSASTATSPLCSTAGTLLLNSTQLGGINTQSWTSAGGGNFQPSSTSPNPVYVIMPTDRNNGGVTFTVTTTGSFPCPETSKTVAVIINTIATVSPGANQNLCSNAGTIFLSGNIQGVTNSGNWTTTGSGTFMPNSSVLATQYIMAPSDAAFPSLAFSLTSTNNGPCTAVSNSLNVVFERIATVNVGLNKSACSTTPTVAITGKITGATSTGFWTFNGTGQLSYPSNSLTNIYQITQADFDKGFVELYLTSSNQTLCPAVKDTLRVDLFKKPFVAFTMDTAVCERNNPFAVSANVVGGSGAVQWVSNGTGTFLPTPASPNALYQFSQLDVTTGIIGITLKSVNNGACGDVGVTKNMIILRGAKANFAASAYTVTLPAPPITFNNTSKFANSYSWDFGDNSAKTDKHSPQHSYVVSGYYDITLIANNDYNCPDTTHQRITVISDVKFPNAFTPNPSGPSRNGAYNPDDMSNDVFYPFTSGVVDYKLMIFNRWGELLFTSVDLSVGWDGYFNGKLCQQDTYVWKADITFFDGRSYSKTGTLMLLR